ncbi:hypothetical protein CSC81_08225 [Tenacibaculum discolor]|uniref:Uncharacterized protein n=2 Tax=Tenacibaculum discolor TaxID=361581 RepID=A0A2G1BU31_9FLAO|nr:hypothetical protein CSC81_08225 [Tenacibaculum discolor]
MKMKIKLLLLITFSTNTIFSQFSGGSKIPKNANNIFNNNMDHFAMAKIDMKFNNEFGKNVHGTYYLSKTWKKCKITTKKKKTYTFQSCNYNLFDKRFEIKFDEKDYIYLKKETINQITFDNKIFKPIDVSLYTDSQNNYYQEITQNKNITLAKLYRLEKKITNSTESLGIIENKIVNRNSNYLIKDKRFIKIPKSKRKVLSILNIEYKKEEHKKLNTKNTKHIKKLIENL